MLNTTMPASFAPADAHPAHFDYAASAPPLSSVSHRVHRLLARYPVHSTDCVGAARMSVGQFVGADTDQVVVFTRNTTDALNLLACCVPGDTVVLDLEHPANFLPWDRHGRRVVPAADTVAETMRRLVAALCARPAALVSVTGASNLTGEGLPLARLADLVHQCGARLAVDAAQLAPRRRLNLSALGVDYLAVSGHKLYAPFGVGALIGRRDWLDIARPYLGGPAIPAPERHESGTPNLLGIEALAAACDELTTLDPEPHDRALGALLRTELAALAGVRVARVWSDCDDPVGIVGFTVDGHDPADTVTALAAAGITVGRHPDGALRASVGLTTTATQTDALIDALLRMVR